jgi:hypothetical protein
MQHVGQLGQGDGIATKLFGQFLPRSSVRLAMVIQEGSRAAKWVATSSIISPAPMNRMFSSPMVGKICSASFTAAADMDTELEPTAVLLRTSLATAKVRWNRPLSSEPRVPTFSAVRTASFSWPRIWVSPSTMESRPEATRKAWRAALLASSWYR